MTLYPYGGNFNQPGFSIEGEVAIFKKYSKVLSATEVLQNYNALKGRFGR